MMPVMDGIETLHKLLDEHLVPESTTIIALTANAVVGARESYIAEGFADYLSKPIEIKHLVEKLKKYLPQSAYEKKAVEEAGKPAAGVGNTAVEETGRSAAEAGKTAAEESGNVAAGEAAVDFAEEFIEEFAPEGEVSTGFDKGKLAAAGISVETGLHYCTDDELYFDMLTDYVTLGREKVEELKKFYAEQNWKDYKVKVHALKSNSEMVGAMNIHKMAKALEEAAKNEDISYIEAHHSELISAYDKTAADIENCR
jgi:HPt (histidine-containing phosphotransfer) domain-containing protein